MSCAVAFADAAPFGNVESLTVLGRVRALHFQIGGEAGKSQPEIGCIVCLPVILPCGYSEQLAQDLGPLKFV